MPSLVIIIYASLTMLATLLLALLIQRMQTEILGRLVCIKYYQANINLEKSLLVCDKLLKHFINYARSINQKKYF